MNDERKQYHPMAKLDVHDLAQETSRLVLSPSFGKMMTVRHAALKRKRGNEMAELVAKKDVGTAGKLPHHACTRARITLRRMPLTPEDLATIRRMIREEVRAAMSDTLLRDPKLTGPSRSSPEPQRPVVRPQTQGNRWAAQIAAFVGQPDTREGEKYVRGTLQTAALCGFDRGLMTKITSQAAESPDDPYRRGLVQINAVRRWLKARPDIIESVRQEYANKVYERDPSDPP